MKEIRLYRKMTGEEPFTEWLSGLKDKTVRARIRRRIDRLQLGNEGDRKAVGEGVYELRLAFGPGYRVYYGKYGQTIVILLCGGSKRTQTKDILLAKKYWHEITRGERDE